MHYATLVLIFTLFKAQYNSSTQVLAVFFALSLGVALSNRLIKCLLETRFYASVIFQLASLLLTFLLLLVLIWMVAIVSVWGIAVAIVLGMALNFAVRS